MKSESIEKLIPQRSPILMVDELVDVHDGVAKTRLAVAADNFFIDKDGLLAEVGLIEHIAQSASALAGHMAIEAGATEPPVGYIGEIKKFCCNFRPRVGDVLHTTITLGAEVGGVQIITGETSVNNKVAASTQMKIYIQE